jgi:hypothetical protein
MHTNRITIGFITVLVMACGLVLSGFASPAAAKTIVVTTLDDTADSPFNADGACGTGTVGDLPGADGHVSLREPQGPHVSVDDRAARAADCALGAYPTP